MVLTRSAARQVGVTATATSIVVAVGAVTLWAWLAALLGLRLALPLIPAAVVAAPLALTDWKARRLPDAVTLPAGSAVASAMAAAAAAGSSGRELWLAAGLAAGLALVGCPLAARRPVPALCVATGAWSATVVACAVGASARLTAAVVAGALTTGLVLVAHLGGVVSFGDVKISPLLCGAAWATWHPAAGLWLPSAAAVTALCLSTVGGGLVGMLSTRDNGGPLGAFLPGATLAVAVAGMWL